jgi:Mrp family chromosome partitioning ATPase/capsular polysaccharide biosynthesis protein
MTNDQTAPPVLADYVAIAGRRKWLLLLPLIVTPVVAVAFSLSQPKKFEATANVFVTQQNLGAEVAGIQSAQEDPARYTQTQAQLARSSDVAQAAIALARVRGATAGDLLSHSDVVANNNADALKFVVDWATPGAAQALVDAYARAFTTYKQQLDTASIASARDQILARLAVLKKTKQTGGALYGSLVAKEQQLRTLQLLQTSTSVVSPSRSASQVAPTPKRSALLGVLFGLLIGVTSAFVWEALDRRVRSAKEIEDVLAYPLLARIPAPSRRYAHGLAMVDDPRSSTAEAVRRLRANLEFANLDRHARSIMVTSAVAQEGKSTTAANLAVAIAESGSSVVLVDLDLRTPSLPTLLEYGLRPGVSEVVRGQADLRTALIPIRVAGNPRGRDNGAQTNGDARSTFSVDVLPAGLVLPVDPTQIIESVAFDKLLSDLTTRYDHVLFDAPPLLAVAETIPLSLKVDAMVAVSRVGVVQRAALTDLARALAASPTPTLGMVVTGAHDPGSEYGPYGYGGAPDTRERRRTLLPTRAAETR